MCLHVMKIINFYKIDFDVFFLFLQKDYLKYLGLSTESLKKKITLFFIQW